MINIQIIDNSCNIPTVESNDKTLELVVLGIILKVISFDNIDIENTIKDGIAEFLNNNSHTALLYNNMLE